jgi:hypothetical protein
MKTKTGLVIIVSFLFLSAVICFPADRGISIVTVKNSEGIETRLYKESFALLIGISDYVNGWPKLPRVNKDIEEVRNALEKHGFIITVVMDPDRMQLVRAYEEFINRHGIDTDNRLLFYFAGHGHTVKQSYGDEMGYIVPVDAPNPNINKDIFMAKALDMQFIEVLAKRIQSKHALFLFDSCFSGSLFSLSRAVPESISYKTTKPVRQFITAGGPDEQVPDNSVFREQFVSALNGETEIGRDGYITGSVLGEYLQTSVTNYSKGSQHPQYGKLRNPNLDKGDFVFQIQGSESRTNFITDHGKSLPEKSSAAMAAIDKFNPDTVKKKDTRYYVTIDSDYPEFNFRPFEDRFIIEIDGSIYDNLLKKKWLVIPDSIFNLDEAKYHLKMLEGNWRLPNREELQTLITKKISEYDWGRINNIFKANKRTSKFWTASSSIIGGYWFVDFNSGTLAKESGQNYNGIIAITDVSK